MRGRFFRDRKLDIILKDSERFYQRTIVVWFGALICCLLWGSAFPCIKIGYKLFRISSEDTMTQILFAGIRFALAGILAIVIGCITSRQMLMPRSKQAVGRVFKLSSLQTVGQYIFFYIGMAHTTGVKASIVESVNVFVALFVAALIFHQEKLTVRKLVGSLMGFIGVVIVNVAGGSEGLAFNLIGDGFIFMSTVAYAFSSVFLKRYSKEDNPVMLSGYQFLVGGIVMAAIGAAGGGELMVNSYKCVILLIYLAFISAVAYTLWGILLKYNPISRVAVFGFMNPVFGVILSAIFLREGSSLGLVSVLAFALICAGIVVVNGAGDSKNNDSK